MNAIGVYYAVKGSDSSHPVSPKYALGKVLRMPVAYGALLGILFQLCHISLSDSILTSISMIGEPSIVIVMIILGMQLAKLHIREMAYTKIVFALFTKMTQSPMIASDLVYFMPLDSMYKQILIVLAAMPSAANTTLLSVQFNTKPELVARATFISTMLSLITLPIVLWLVGTPIPSEFLCIALI